MNITLTIPAEALPAYQHRLDTYNAGSGQPPVTLQELLQIEQNEKTAQLSDFYAAYLRSKAKDVMNEIITAAGGDQAKITAALEAGKTAALEAIAE